MSTRLVRVSDRFDAADKGSNIGIEMLDYSDKGRSSEDQPEVEENKSISPIMVTHDELICLKDFLSLPLNLDV